MSSNSRHLPFTRPERASQPVHHDQHEYRDHRDHRDQAAHPAEHSGSASTAPERTSAPLPLSVSTLAPVALLCLASSVASAALSAWIMGSAKDEQIGQIREALQTSQARAQVLEVLALNGMGGEQAREAVAQLNAASAPAPAQPGVTPGGSAKAAATTAGASLLARSGATPAQPAPQQVAPSRSAAVAPSMAPSISAAPAMTANAATAPTATAAFGARPPAAPSTSPYAQSPRVAQPSPAAAQDLAPGDSAPMKSAVTAPPPVEVITQSQGPSAPAAAPAPPATAPAPPATAPTPAPKTATPGSAVDRMTFIPAQQLGVARIEPGVVVMLSGKRVKVGETFDSGEVLREADPARNRIVTDLRTVGLL